MFKIKNNEKWYGLAASPSAETHRADRMKDEIAPFPLLTGSKVFGDWVQILGSSDTPLEQGKLKFDLNKVLITTSSNDVTFIIQIVTGASTGIAAKLTAEDFTEFPYEGATVANYGGIIELSHPRITAGDKVWARACSINASAKTINLYFCIQEI